MDTTSSTATEALMRHALGQCKCSLFFLLFEEPFTLQVITYAFEMKSHSEYLFSAIGEYYRWLPVRLLMASKVALEELPILVA